MCPGALVPWCAREAERLSGTHSRRRTHILARLLPQAFTRRDDVGA